MAVDDANAALPADLTFRKDFVPVDIHQQLAAARSEVFRYRHRHELATSKGADINNYRTALSPQVYAHGLRVRQSVVYTLLQLQGQSEGINSEQKLSADAG